MSEEMNNIKISVEQICAAIITTVGSVEVPLETLIKDYSNMNISVEQDEDTKAFIFKLVEGQTENE
jgi:hypothetical protein